ncbi:MAG: hypothetical protein QNK36_08900 [Colwellia sp.]|nr:hypothetical protein [Colwellia sp.]
MKLQIKSLTQSRQWLSDSERAAISEIIKFSFSNISPDAYLAKYFDGTGAFQRKLRLYFDGVKLVGYCLLTFSDESRTIVIRASAGFFPEYRKGGNTFKFSLSESFKCWLHRPWRKIYYADTMLSPAMYRAMAKNIGIIWPHPNHQVPDNIFEKFNSNGEVSKEVGLRCLIPVDRASNYSENELEDFKSSDKLEIQYYRSLNPDFNNGVALFVIIPVHFRQFIKTALKKFIGR